jgi:hypothetical protein
MQAIGVPLKDRKIFQMLSHRARVSRIVVSMGLREEVLVYRCFAFVYHDRRNPAFEDILSSFNQS